MSKKEQEKASSYRKPNILKEVKIGESQKLNTIQVSDTISIKDIAKKIKKTPGEIIKFLLLEGKVVNINSNLDKELVELVCLKYGYEIDFVEEVSMEDFEKSLVEDEKEKKEIRPPIVTIMGHVDHGKTTLLDQIRKSKVVHGEHGGITQSIGAYQVEVNKKKITFLDTPGHEAFAAMRARGAKATDIAIIVVAADDGVMPQTKEAIDHAKAADVPIIIAINKIDKPNKDLERIKSELSEYGIVSEEWGGENIFCKISALKDLGLDKLLESVLVISELEEYKANPNRYAIGTVIESSMEKGRGCVATLLVQNGTLLNKDAIVAGTSFGRVRQMKDDKGKIVKKATPSKPVEVTGLSDVPVAGEMFMAFDNEKIAKSVANKRLSSKINKELSQTSATSLEEIQKQIKEGEKKAINLIIKTDSDGSSEAVKQALLKLNEKEGSDEVKINVVRSQAGAISASDVLLASASNSLIYGFNVRPDSNVRRKAAEERVEIRLHKIIYAIVEEVQSAIKGMLKPIYKEKISGTAQVRNLFKVSKIGTIAGCYVKDGAIKRDDKVRLIRNNVVVYEGEIESLKRLKDDVKEARKGQECGIVIKNFNDIKIDDIIEGYNFIEEKKD